MMVTYCKYVCSGVKMNTENNQNIILKIKEYSEANGRNGRG